MRHRNLHQISLPRPGRHRLQAKLALQHRNTTPQPDTPPLSPAPKHHTHASHPRRNVTHANHTATLLHADCLRKCLYNRNNLTQPPKHSQSPGG
jgi:hypothetical protein